MRTIQIFGITLLGMGFALVLLAGAGASTVTLAHNETPFPTPTPYEETDSNLTYYQDIEPILEANCVTCHLEGGIGYETYPMDDPLHLLETAQDLAFVTSTGYMPPWMPGPNSQPFLNDRSLTDEEIAILVNWAEAGAPLGTGGDVPVQTSATNLPTFAPNLTLTMPVAYTPESDSLDDYRCFMLEPGFEEDTYVTGFDIKPGQTSIAHHVIIYLAPENKIEEAMAKDAEDDRPGWECYGGSGLDSGGTEQMTQMAQQLPDDLPQEMRNMAFTQLGASGLGGGLGSWAPGAMPTVFPSGTGRMIPAGTKLIMQMHYNLTSPAVPDQSQLLLQTTDQEVTRLKGQVLLGPVEIPCSAGYEGEVCSRDYALQTSELGFVSDAMLSLCGQSVEDFTGQTDGTITAYCDQPIRSDGWILAVGSHMHELGSQITIDLYPDTPEQITLIDIPFWDFHWQDNYWLVNPIPVKEGDMIRIICTWDSTDIDHYMVWGEGTQDEMCVAPLQMLPAEEGKTLADYGFEEPHTHAAEGAHEHSDAATLEVATEIPVELDVQPDPVSGWNLHVEAPGFTFAPEHAGAAHVEGEGHAHLYVDGQKVARLYSDWYHLDVLPSGTHEIKVTLNANSHEALTYGGAPLEAAVEITVP
jgi:hypothetical protein